MSHGVGPLFLTAPNDSEVLRPLSTLIEERRDSPNLVVGLGDKTESVIQLGSTRIDSRTIQGLPDLSKIYWNPITSEWAADTQMTVAVFTTPSASVGGQSLNPLSKVDEEEFVTADGAKYLEESGIRETTGLGPNPSWTVPPAEVASRSIRFLGNQATMRSYVGYVKTDDSEIPQTVLVNLATTETDDDIAFGVTVQYRDMYNLGGDATAAPTDAILSAMTVPDLVGTEPHNGLNASTGDAITLILEAGVAASADLAATALGDLSLT